MAKAAFGYAEDDPALQEPPDPPARHRLRPPPQGRRADRPGRTSSCHRPVGRNAVVCLAQWRDSSSKGSSYDRLSAEVAAPRPPGRPPPRPGDRRPDRRDDLPGRREGDRQRPAGAGAGHGRHDQRRRGAGDRHPAAGGPLGLAHRGRCPEVPRKALHAVYDALVAAADFFALRNRHAAGFDFPDAAALYRAYETDLFRFDQLYRQFCEAADQAESSGLGHPQAAAGRPGGGLHELVRAQARPRLGQVRRAQGPTGLLSEVADRAGAEPAGVLRAARPAPARRGRQPPGVRHHQRCLPLRGGPGTGPGTQRQVPLRGHADLATRRAAVVHGPGHGEPAAPQDAGLQAERRRAGGRQADVVHRPAERDPAGRRRHGVQGGRTAGDEEGRGPGVRPGQAGRLHLPQRRSMPSATRRRPRRRPSRACGRRSTSWRRWSATSSTT